MNHNPYSSPTSVAIGRVDECSRSNPLIICEWAFGGGLMSFGLYLLAVYEWIDLPIFYTTPTFYILRDFFYFHPAAGFIIQCVMYGVLIGSFAYNRRTKTGIAFVALVHALSVLACRNTW